MRRSRTLLFALMVALVAALVLPVAASAGSSFDRDCEDFSSQEDAQAALDSGVGDQERLDGNDDDEACESFDYGDTFVEDDVTFEEYPREGIASGGGSTAAGGPSPLPLLVSAGVFALLATGSWASATRRRWEQ